jgi:hypothetical protein
VTRSGTDSRQFAGSLDKSRILSNNPIDGRRFPPATEDLQELGSMSEEVHATADHGAAVAVAPSADSHGAAARDASDPLFTEQQIEQFEEDDGDAGRAIGKMLATFFLYTLIVMSIVGWWTYYHQSDLFH